MKTLLHSILKQFIFITHAHRHTHTHSLTHSLTHTHTQTHTLTRTHTHAHTRTHIGSRSLSKQRRGHLFSFRFFLFSFSFFQTFSEQTAPPSSLLFFSLDTGQLLTGDSKDLGFFVVRVNLTKPI